MASDFGFSSARDIALQVKSKKITALEATESHLNRIQSLDPKLHSYLHVDSKGALEQAKDVERRLSAGEDLPLAGVPFGIKDALLTKGLPTTCGSKILEGWHPPRDATVVRRLRKAGAVILGKNNLDEFAMGSSTENSAYGPTHNPWDLKRVPGGSSGGSGAAVAAGLATASLGSDTGGSIRQPAAFCGITGLKPTYGSVSRFGLIAFASSLDQVGPLARDIRDVALILKVISGHDPMDSTSADKDLPQWDSEKKQDVKDLKLAILPDSLHKMLDQGVQTNYQQALDKFFSLGAKKSEAKIYKTSPEAALAAYYIVAPSEASSNLSRFDGVRYGPRHAGKDVAQMMSTTRGNLFGKEVKRRIMIGTYALSSGYYDAYYLRALKVRRLLALEYEEIFRTADLVAIPTTPTTAFGLGDKTGDPLSMYLADLFTVAVNLAGLPAVSIPCGFDDNGLPVGLQLIAPAFREDLLYRAAAAFQDATDYHKQIPAGFE